MADHFDEDGPTLVRRKITLEDMEALLEARDELAELTEALQVPDEVEPTAFARLLVGVFAESVRRASLEQVSPTAVALAATPASLLELAGGGSVSYDDPLAALTRRGASA